jgi:hypothetical protein
MENKNIWLLPTDKPSRLVYLTKKGKEIFKDLILFDRVMPNILDSENQNIYITFDEEVKEDYVFAYGVVIKVLMFDKETLYFVNGTKAKREDCKKIILTTDQDLIKDGVQSIDDEFLEWFVKNPSCEFAHLGFKSIIGDSETKRTWKIINPKEEPKQENALEEFAKVEAMKQYSEDTFGNLVVRKSIEKGAKWQEEQQDEFAIEFAKWCAELKVWDNENYVNNTFEELLEQFKNK